VSPRLSQPGTWLATDDFLALMTVISSFVGYGH
jgi:hypothetical protein